MSARGRGGRSVAGRAASVGPCSPHWGRGCCLSGPFAPFRPSADRAWLSQPRTRTPARGDLRGGDKTGGPIAGPSCGGRLGRNALPSGPCRLGPVKKASPRYGFSSSSSGSVGLALGDSAGSDGDDWRSWLIRLSIRWSYSAFPQPTEPMSNTPSMQVPNPWNHHVGARREPGRVTTSPAESRFLFVLCMRLLCVGAGRGWTGSVATADPRACESRVPSSPPNLDCLSQPGRVSTTLGPGERHSGRMCPCPAHPP